MELQTFADFLGKGGPYLGPRGGLWADSAHTKPYGKPKLVIHPKDLTEHSYGIAREHMPQIHSSLVREFLGKLKSHGISVKKRTRKVSDLKATQGEIHTQQVAEMAGNRKARAALRKRVIVSKDGYLLDGHHRWATLHALNPDAKIPTYEVDLPIGDLLVHAQHFSGVSYKKGGLMPPGSGWMPVPQGRHGGFRRRSGGGWEYWYPGRGISAPHMEHEAQPMHPDEAKPRPPVPQPAPVEGIRMPAFVESRAVDGSATQKLENGTFAWKKWSGFEPDADGTPRRIERLVPGVDDATKVALLAEYEGLIVNTARQVQRSFGLKSQMQITPDGRQVDQTAVELRQAAMEGLLQAMQTYKPIGSFAARASAYAKDFTRMHAAQEYAGGFAIPHRHARLLHGFIAARAEAARHGFHDPDPETVARFWHPKKRDLHAGLGKEEGSIEIPSGDYKLAIKRLRTSPEGKKETHVVATDTVSQPGRVEWAKRFHAFLTGQKTAAGADFFEDDAALFPAVNAGSGLGAEERIAIRQAVLRSSARLQRFVVNVGNSTYRGNAAQVIDRALGLKTGEAEPLSDIVTHVPIEMKIGEGKWRRAGTTAARKAMEQMLHTGLAVIARKYEGGDDAIHSVVSQVAEAMAPTVEAKPGLTMTQKIRASMPRVTPEDTKQWRGEERKRLHGLSAKLLARSEGATLPLDRQHQADLAEAAMEAARRVDRMGDAEVRRRIVERRIMDQELSPEMRREMLHHVRVEAHQPYAEHGHMVFTITDPSTGAERHVRASTMKDLRSLHERVEGSAGGGATMLKSMKQSKLNAGMLWEWTMYPSLSELRWGSDDSLADAPTRARAKLDAMMGLL